MIELLYNCTVQDGTLLIANKALFDDDLNKFKNNELLEIIIRPRAKKRSVIQNNLYWRWLSIIETDTGFSKDDLHEIMKYKFLQREVIKDDEVMQFVQSTTKLSTAEFSEYMNKVKDFAMYFLKIKLPEQ